MTSTYVFRNAGVLDPRSITTFGVSSKEGKNPIGFFGTGLKYAIAVLLRLKCGVTIHSGGETYEFTHKSTRIRVDDFDLVHMNGVPCGFTTELGKGWEVWQAFRELACNCIDEEGAYYETHEAQAPFDAHTIVQVTGSAFADAWSQRNSIILTGTPLETVKEVEIHEGNSEWLYYRGVRVQKLALPSLYTYNLLEKQELTEDRTLKYQWSASSTITAAIKNSSVERIVRAAVLGAAQLTYEGDFHYSGPVQETFRSVVTEELTCFNLSLNRSAAELIKKGNRGQFMSDDTRFLDKLDQQRLKIAVAFCERLGFSISEYPVIVSKSMGDSVLGMAENKTIYISSRVFLMGTKMLAGTLIEEYLHLKHGLQDETRSMQNYLMDQIVSMGERITRKPL